MEQLIACESFHYTGSAFGSFGSYFLDSGRVQLVLPQGHLVKVDIDAANLLYPIILSERTNQSLLDGVSNDARRGVGYAQMVFLDKARVRSLSMVCREGDLDVPKPDKSVQVAKKICQPVSMECCVGHSRAVGSKSRPQYNHSRSRIWPGCRFQDLDSPLEKGISAGVDASDNSQGLRAPVAINTALRFHPSWQSAY